MTDNITRLAVSNSAPLKRGCSDCRFYMPNTSWPGGVKRVMEYRWGFWPTGRILSETPTVAAHQHALCTMFGGTDAKIERCADMRCGEEGKYFQPKD